MAHEYNSMENVRPSCANCNRKKHAKSPETFALKVLGA